MVSGGAEIMGDFLFNIFPNERYIDITLFQYGWERCKPLHSYGPATRNHYLFHFVISGKGVLYSTDSQDVTHIYHLKPGQGFIIYPQQITTYMADEKEPWEYAWVEFDGIRAREYVETAGLTYDSPIYRCGKKEQAVLLENELLTLAKNKKASSLYQIGHLYLFLDQLIQSSASQKEMTEGKLKDFYVREAVTFIEQNCSQPITIEDIAGFCNLNRSYLGKIFRESMNQTLQQFLIYFRMNKAAEMLKFSDMSINEIGRSVGYPNQLHFSRAFKKTYGTSPSQWRKENKKVGTPKLS